MIRRDFARLATAIIPALFAAKAQAAASGEGQRILAYGDSNTWGYVARSDGGPTERYPSSVRWTGRLQTLLGQNFTIIEDGLNLRTTDLDGEDWDASIIRANAFNGAYHLPVAIAAQMPLDLVIVMLGTNDLQARYERSAEEVANAAANLIQMIRAAGGGIGNSYPAPRVLLVSPMRVGHMPVAEWARRYEGAQSKSAQFSEAFERVAAKEQIPIVDAAAAIGGAVHGIDGLHLSPADHDALAKAVARAILHQGSS